MRAYEGKDVGAALVKMRLWRKFEIEMPDVIVVGKRQNARKCLHPKMSSLYQPEPERTRLPAKLLNSKLSKIIHPFCNCFKFQRHSKIDQKIQYLRRRRNAKYKCPFFFEDVYVLPFFFFFIVQCCMQHYFFLDRS